MNLQVGSEGFVSAADAERYRAEGYWSLNETIPGLLARAVRDAPRRVAVVDDSGARLTYSDLQAMASRIAAGLAQRGIGKGDVVGVQLPNRAEASAVMCGIAMLGAVVNPLVPAYRERELDFIAGRTGMKALFVPGSYRDYDYERLALHVRERATTLETIVSLAATPASRRVTSLDRLLREGGEQAEFESPKLDPDAISAVLFTSGTEADPKGILHSQNTLLANLRSVTRLLGLGEQDHVFMASPVGHGTGFGFGIELAIYLGSKLVLLSAWDAARAARMLTDERCGYTHGATPFAQDLLELPGVDTDYDLSSLRYFVSGGANIPAGMWTRMRERVGCQLLRLYGQTEGFMTTINRPNDELEKLERTDGLPAPGVEVRVLDDEGREAAPGATGEVVYKGPHRCLGFLNDAERARNAIVGDGWFRSGDLVSLDEAGYLTVAGRKKEIVNRGGYKYSPREVEDILAGHPAIQRVAIVPYADHRLGEKACVFAVLRAGAALTLEEVTAYLRGAGIATFKWPERLELVDSLPMTASGKVQKFVLERQLSEAKKKVVAR